MKYGMTQAGEMARRVSSTLDEKERAAFAWASLRTLDKDNALAVVESAISHAGFPSPVWMAPMDDARFWAEMATRQELKAYALASWEAMKPHDRQAFLKHIQTQEDDQRSAKAS